MCSSDLPVGEILSYFDRDTIANRYTFPNGLNHLIKLNPYDSTDAAIISNAGFNPNNAKEDWELLRGRAAGIYTFKKQTVDDSDRITQIIEYPAGASVGDIARKTIFTYTDTNTTPDEIFEIPYVLTSNDLIEPEEVVNILGSLWLWEIGRAHV